MARELTVNMGLNNERFQSGIKDAAGELGKLVDELEQIDGTDYDNVPMVFEDLDRAADDAADSVGKVADEASDATREIGDAEDAANDFGNEAEDAGDRARDGMEEAGDAASTFRDTARDAIDDIASGDLSGLGDSLADGLSNFGAAGVVAGGLVAGGIELVNGLIDSNKAKTEEAAEAAANWAQAYIDGSGNAVDAMVILGNVQDIVTDPEQWQQAQGYANLTGLDLSVILNGLAGDAEALAAVQARLNQIRAEGAAGEGVYADGLNGSAAAQQTVIGMLEGAEDRFNGVSDAMAAGAEQAAAYNDALVWAAQNTAGATQEVDEFGDSIYSLPDGTVIYIDAETGQATTNVEAIDNRIFGPGGIDGQTATIGVQTGSPNTASLDGLLNTRYQINVDVVTRNRRGADVWV